MIVVIVGPTAIGKTRLGVEVAKAFKTEVISGDSMQVYRQLDIGTAKVTEKEAAGIPHHMIDIINYDEPFSVAKYQKTVRKLVDQQAQQNKLPLIVGGTGFYIKTVLHDFEFDHQPRDENFASRFDHLDNATVYAKLEALDKAAAQKVHKNNRKRVLRQLEMAMQGEKPSQKTGQDKAIYDYIIVGLTCNRKMLHQRIDERVDIMVQNGLVEEAYNLYQKVPNAQSGEGIGYKELFSYFEGRFSLQSAIETIKRNTRRFAKRQYTYFNNQFEVEWFHVDRDDFDDITKQVVQFIQSNIDKKHLG